MLENSRLPPRGVYPKLPFFIYYYYFVIIIIIIIIIGLSALAVEAYGFTLVRPSVRPFVRSFDPRIRFF